MWIHPKFNPVFFNLGPLSFRWYGLMYLLGFIVGVSICRWQLKYEHIYTQGWKKSDIDDFLFYIVLGVVLGGRFGYVLFYNFSYYLSSPVKIFAIWEGGMSFHGGLMGVVFLLFLYWYKHKKMLFFLQVTDFIVPAIPFGIAAGRFGNFINGELWGRVTSKGALWAMGFPQAIFDDFTWLKKYSEVYSSLNLFNNIETFQIILPRHPSQLYEMFLEGIFLLLILLWFAKKPRPVGLLTGIFLGWYGIARFVVEFTRQPDDHLGLLAFKLSMGQWLSLPMIIVGFLLIIFSFLNINIRNSKYIKEKFYE